ncbi:MAG: DOMON domain-containing protein [Candidatus Hodarchaeales archaeon]|jgi:hypothetical protein
MLVRGFCLSSAFLFMLLIIMPPGPHTVHSSTPSHLDGQKVPFCSDNRDNFPATGSSVRSPTATDTIPYNPNHNGSTDGLLGTGEYKSQLEISSSPAITFYWEHNGTLLFWAANCSIDGYFSIGWPIKDKIDAKMNELDMIFTFGNDSGVYVYDTHATSRFGHGPDTDQTRIVSFGSDNQSTFFIEMALKLASEDTDDISLELEGTYEFWFVWHAQADSFAASGHGRTSNQFMLEKAEIDTDQDGLLDSEESSWGTSPSNNDTDGDGLKDGTEALWELANGSMQSPLYFDPTNADTNGNGINDPAEDYDEDGLTSLQEVGTSTHPLLTDTDGDKLSDGDEVTTHGTDPLLADSDGDILTDGEEVAQDRDPLHASINIAYNRFHQGEVDGAINANEYRSSFTDINHTKITVYWEHDGELLYVALASNTSGWLSFGWSIEPIVGLGTFQMQTMDLVIGAVSSGNILQIMDHHGTSNWTHGPDLDFAQIERAHGLDNGYATTIEFSLHLESSDTEQDVPLEPGEEYFLALAYGLFDEMGLHDGVTRDSVQFYIAVPYGSETISEEEDDFNPLDPFDLVDQLDLLTITFLTIAGLSGIAVVVLTLYVSKQVQK